MEASRYLTSRVFAPCHFLLRSDDFRNQQVLSPQFIDHRTGGSPHHVWAVPTTSSFHSQLITFYPSSTTYHLPSVAVLMCASLTGLTEDPVSSITRLIFCCVLPSTLGAKWRRFPSYRPERTHPGSSVLLHEVPHMKV